MKTYTAAVIGLSEIASARINSPADMPWLRQMPRSHVAAYAAHPQIELVGVCDIAEPAIRRFEETWRDALPNTRTYRDYGEMLAREKPDILSVVTPDHVHAQPVLDGVEAGVRAIFCEKPIATTLADADRMIAACEARGVRLSVNLSRRWGAVFHKARQLIRSGKFGRLRAIYTTMHQPRAMLFRNGVHFVDVMNFLADAPAQWVMAELEEGFEHFTHYVGDGGREPTSEPSANAYVAYANGARGYLGMSKVSNTHFEFSLACEDAVLGLTHTGVSVTRSEYPAAPNTIHIGADNYQNEWELAAVSELVHVLDHGGPLVSDGRNARHTLAVLLAMLDSHARGNVRVTVDG